MRADSPTHNHSRPVEPVEHQGAPLSGSFNSTGSGETSDSFAFRMSSLYFQDDEKTEKTILVPLPGIDGEDQDTPDPNDELAAELSLLHQKSKSIAIIGSRNIPLPHQQLIELMSLSLTREGNRIITSGGAFGTNAAAIRGAMRGNPDLLKVILPQTIGQQPSDVQDQLIGIPHITEHPEWSMMKLADASRLCNREIVDECQQLIILLSHDSPTLQSAIDYANENHKLVTCLYLD